MGYDTRKNAIILSPQKFSEQSNKNDWGWKKQLTYYLQSMKTQLILTDNNYLKWI